MEFATEDFGGARLVVPDEPTVFQLVSYDSKRYERNGLPQLLLLWEMAKILIIEWECEALPDKDTSLLEITENADNVASVIEWASLIVSAWRRSLDNIPKNS
jgi:hypothetical protein